MDQNISSRINLMRIVLIGGIVFVHVPFDDRVSPFLHANAAFDWLRVFLGESLFRIGVPCLSAISGYLLFQRGYEDFHYRRTLAAKSRSILLPFLIWNGSLLLLILLMQHFDLGQGYFPDLDAAAPADWADHAFAFNDFPINLPLYFLRDLMVCILLSPVLAYLVQRWPFATLGALFVLAVLPDIDLEIFLRESIVFSFTLGIALALHRVDVKALDSSALVVVAVLAASSVALAFGLYGTGPDYPEWLDILRTGLSIFGAAGFWVLSSLMIKTSVGRRLSQTGSLSFWTFCAHYPLLLLMWMIWNHTTLTRHYWMFYVGAALATFTILVVTNAAASRWMPGFYQILTGSRGRARKALTESSSQESSDAPVTQT